jgi:hypothetical protein
MQHRGVGPFVCDRIAYYCTTKRSLDLSVLLFAEDMCADHGLGDGCQLLAVCL